MADANSATGTATTEDIQNGENENSENKLVEAEATSMEVDGVDGATVEEAQITEIKVEEKEPVEDAGQTECKTVETPVDGEAETETQVKTEVDEATGGVVVEATGTGVKEEVVEEVQVKVEGEKDGGDVDSYMVLEEADGGDNESNASDDEELTEVEQLRKANFLLSERLALLEEFVEIEFSDKFGKFVNKRERLVDVVGLGQKYDGTAKVSGKRSAKSLELAGLLRIVNDQAKSNGGYRSTRRLHRNGPSSSTSTSAAKEQGATTSVDSKKDGASTAAGSNDAAKPIRCHRCKATGHLVRQCPMPHDPHDRRVVLKRGRGPERRREGRREKKARDREEAEQFPALKMLKDKRRRIGRQMTRERQKIINPWATGL